MRHGENAKYLEVSLASCLCGSVFGDNTSPISDTTILVSSSTQCSFLVHVSTQLPYAITVAAISLVGYIIAGYSGGNLAVTLISSIVLLLVVLAVISVVQKKGFIGKASLEIELPEVNKEEIKEEVKEEVKEESQEGEKEGNEKDLFSDPVVSLSQEAVNTSSVVQVPETTPQATENAMQ